MRGMARAALLVLTLVSISQADEAATRFELDNGLKVWLRPVKGAADVALCVLYDLGEDHDPEGMSGLAHVVEHCYVTSAAGDAPPRTAEQMMEKYPQGWNAQTGTHYTVIAFVFPPDRLEAEIAEAAARMGHIQITDHDLEREAGRVLVELSNMFDRFPALVGRNRAREHILPRPRAGRKGGVPADVEKLGLESVQAHHRRYYKPRNARLVVAGGFDAARTRALVTEHFARLPPGEPPPPPGESAVGRPGTVEVHRALGVPPGFAGHACIAYPAPPPDDVSFAAFVVLAGRFFGAQNRKALPDGVRVDWTALDEPDVLYASAAVAPGEAPEAAVERLRQIVREVASKPLTLGDRMLARQLFARLLATVPLPETVRQGDAYGVAFGLGRRDQMGIDGEALGKALLEVNEAAFRAVADRVLAEEVSAAVVAVGGP